MDRTATCQAAARDVHSLGREAPEFPEISGDEKLVKRVWEEVDALGYMYIWQCLLSF